MTNLPTENTPPPVFTGEEREWFVQLLQSSEQRISGSVARQLKTFKAEEQEKRREQGRRITALEKCLPENCGVDEIASQVEEIGERLHSIEESHREAREEQKELQGEVREVLKSLSDARERLAKQEGKEEGEAQAEKRLARMQAAKRWALPAGVGTTIVAIVLAVLSKVFGVQAASQKPEGPPNIQSSGNGN